MNTNSLKAYEARFGARYMETSVANMLVEADSICGGGTDPGALKTMSRLLLDDFGGMPAGCFIQAMKEGVKGKVVGHKLTYPILCEWMHEQDKRVEEYNYNQYLATR